MYVIRKKLLANGAEIDTKNKKGESLITVLESQPTIKNLVIAESNRRKVQGNFFLSAVKKGDLAFTKKLLATTPINTVDKQGYSALHIATFNNDLNMILMLLAQGINPDVKNNKGVSSLMIATNKGDLKTVKMLLNQKANVNLTDSKNRSALHFTVSEPSKKMHDYAQIAKLLINAGADINAQTDKGLTPLNIAIVGGKDKTSDVLLDMGADVNIPTKQGNTPLIQIFSSKPTNIQLMQKLIAKGADVNHQNSSGFSPLITAVDEGNIEAVKLLLKNKADVNLTTLNGWSALHVTVNESDNPKHDYYKIAKLLVKAGADINARNDKGMTPLNQALANRKPKVSETLLNLGADVNLVSNYNQTPLMFVVGQKPLNYKLAQQLINRGADLNFRYPSGDTLLIAAIREKMTALIDLILKNKVDVNKAGKGKTTAIIEAVRQGDLSLIKKLIKARANTSLVNSNKENALHIAVENSENKKYPTAAIFKILFSEKTKLNQRDKLGNTPLLKSISAKKKQAMQLLLSQKTDASIPDNEGWTPLMSAVNNGDLAAVKKLLKLKVNVNSQEKDGWSALHLTVNNKKNKQHDFPKIAQLLLSKGAKINLKTNAGYTPLMIASINNKPKTMNVLLKNRNIDISAVNWKNRQKSALDYAVNNENYELADLLRRKGASSGVAEAKYPSKPAGKAGYTTCKTSCANGDCYRTYSDGRKTHFQAKQKFNPFTNQYEWDSGSC